MMLLFIAQHLMPEFIKRRKLLELFRMTANAFQTEMPMIKGLSFTWCLSAYAAFTRQQSEKYLRSGRPLDALKSRLYEDSFRFGERLRKSLRVKTWRQSVAAMALLYKLIGIEFHHDVRGEFTITKCLFSAYYTKETCGLISSMDGGLAAGLSGNGRLSFAQRITEGAACCRGYFIREGEI